ncbi:MAG: biopolymer transporter ExbD [Bacteroidetes bacterium]|jgi:biopolymer transport protein ExbD|nr:biopolymer transporter ExbD [Bacteroidota bacterium]
MPKVKKHRMSIAIDMTPLVDVAFLLLTFFMLTTQFRPPEDIQVSLPPSHAKSKMPESDVITITFSPDGKYYFGLDSQQLRAQLFGERNKLKASIPVTLEEMTDLAQQARSANPKLRTIIKGDRTGPYGPAEDVMNALQKANIARFELVTTVQTD